MKVKIENEVAQSCPTHGDPMDYSPLGSSIHGIFQARVLDWGAIAKGSKKKDFLSVAFLKNVCMISCFSVSDSCDPMDCSLLGSSIHGIFQARVLEWVAISLSNA